MARLVRPNPSKTRNIFNPANGARNAFAKPLECATRFVSICGTFFYPWRLYPASGVFRRRLEAFAFSRNRVAGVSEMLAFRVMGVAGIQVADGNKVAGKNALPSTKKMPTNLCQGSRWISHWREKSRVRSCWKIARSHLGNFGRTIRFLVLDFCLFLPPSRILPSVLQFWKFHFLGVG